MAKKFNSVWPPPVYCAQFADGEVIRMSFSTPVNKPLDFARGARLCCGIKGAELAAQRWETISAECLAKGSIMLVAPERLQDLGYFETNQYRQTLRFYAQRLCDSLLAPRKLRFGRKTTRHGWSGGKIEICGLPIFRTRLPRPAPAIAVDGWVERADERIDDPSFARATVTELAPMRARKSPLEKAMALLPALSAAERATLIERLAA